MVIIYHKYFSYGKFDEYAYLMITMLERPVGIYAKKNVVVISQNETIGYTYQFMIKYNVRHISIIDNELKLAGILSRKV